MTVLKESPEAYIQQCKWCGAVLKYSLHDIHPEAIPHFNKNGKFIGHAGFESILCPCCENILPAVKERILPMDNKTYELIKLYQDCVWESIQEVLGEKIIREELTREELFSYMELKAMHNFNCKTSYMI